MDSLNSLLDRRHFGPLGQLQQQLERPVNVINSVEFWFSTFKKLALPVGLHVLHTELLELLEQRQPLVQHLKINQVFPVRSLNF